MRTFEDKPAVREAVPLILGLVGPSSSGKTFSALRLGTGIQSVVGGDIGVIDTESKRALHYADKFKFRHLPFGAPFSPADYLAAFEHFVRKGVKTIIVDSMSHEWEGPGGVLEMHDEEFKRMGSRNAVKMLAWGKPKAEHRRMVNSFLQLPAHFIFCFRAKEKLKIEKGKDPVPLGWMPIGSGELIYEMAAKCLLPPGAQGVPDWNPKEVGSREWVKRPGWAESILPEGKPLDEATGAALATWAAGDTKTQATPPKATTPTTGTEEGPLDPLDYDACSSDAEFDALEKKRKAQWSMFSAKDKVALKEAVDRAKARLMEVAG